MFFHNNFCYQVPASRTRARMCSVRRTRSAFPPLTERVPGKNIIIIVIIIIVININTIIITVAIVTMIIFISSSRLTVSASCPIGVGVDRRPAVVSSILIAFILILICFMKRTLKKHVAPPFKLKGCLFIHHKCQFLQQSAKNSACVYTGKRLPQQA